jgi:hypothetical protein
MPLAMRFGLAGIVVVLGVAVLSVAAGGVGVVVGSVGSTVSGFITDVTSTPSAKPTFVQIADAPRIEQPAEPYTNQPTVDLAVIVPQALAGDTDHRVRIYLALEGQSPTAIQEAAIGPTNRVIIPVQLEQGINDFSASIVGPNDTQSDTSATARFVYDDQPPKITISSPKNNATVNGPAVAINGKTQARTTLQARNDANGSSITGTAGADGSFSLNLAIASGVNEITITGTDPAGNVSTVLLNVKRGNGKLTADLRAADYSIKRSQLPQQVTLFATVVDPDGRPLAGANLTFTLSMPGIPTVTTDTTTDPQGKASFQTTVPKGADVGQGSAAVLVSTDAFGSAQDFTVITITK